MRGYDAILKDVLKDVQSLAVAEGELELAYKKGYGSNVTSNINKRINYYKE